MRNSSCDVDYPTIDRKTAAYKINERFGGIVVSASSLIYYSWPVLYGSTSGPFHGISGQAMSEFHMEAWADDGGSSAIIFCRGKEVSITDNFSIEAKY